ncbi:MAG: cytochrome P450 [Rhodospirillaceae bacterium]|jgi:cytochrome P450|nr:cytochrome P450 [Rhodospirillaceae bacterium]MBT4490301.1 cytochrome P450 [Rhodospirillaceae bacterium]MBT5895199.1 cytochrome P450 [Rhodospirillaceae bacterium]MBT6430298.1 cytochrome P450 [Rhodospirillaceae bacterium]
MALAETIKAGPTAGPLDHVPGHMGMPIFGNSFEFLRDPLGFHQRRREQYGRVYKYSILGGRTVALCGADALEYVLMDQDRNFSSRKGWGVLQQLFPNGLMLRDFDDHRSHRRIMQAAFKPRPMRDYMLHLNEGIAHAMGAWAPSERFEFYPAIKELTLELGASVFLGLKMGEEAAKLNQAFVHEIAASLAVLRRPWPGTPMRRGIKARAFLLDYFRDLIPARRAGDGDDMFSQFCKATSDDGAFFTDDDIVDHLNFLLMAAHDTTTSALTTMIWAMAQYPEWQDAMREEVLALGTEQLDYDSLDRLEVTERVFKEALRFRPPVLILPRFAERAFEFAGYEIPGQTSISVSPGLVAMDEELWKQPTLFDPDRFSDNRAEDRSHRFAWAPFGGGAHKCIGMHFAIMQVRAFVHQFLRHYHVALPADYQNRWQAVPIPKPRDGLPIILSRR